MATITSQTLIIGGGIGGLALAHGLKKHNIPFHVYERDRTESYRAQGYRVRIGGPAIPALQSLLDKKTFGDFELCCADMRLAPMPEIDAESARVDEPKIVNQSAGAAIGGPSAGTDKPKTYCVDRTAFREILIKNLPAENISFDKSFSHYETIVDGVKAHFSDGSTAEGGLLVGADGKGSNVRKQFLPELEIQDTGARCIYGKTHITSELLSALQPIAGERMSFVKDRSRDAILAMALEPITFSRREEREARGFSCPDDYLFWVLTAAPQPLGFNATGHEHLSLEESEQRALQVSKHWHPSLRTIIEHQQKGETSAFPITCVSKNFASEPWSSNQHITLLGDAIHPMAPTGSGAVTAITDAETLSQKLAANGLSNTSISEYEASMREMAGKVIPMSWGAVRMMATMTRDNEKHIGEMAMQLRQNNSAMGKKEA